MIDPKFLDDIAKKFSDSLPTSVREFKRDIERSMRMMLQTTFAKLDLVTREEFDVQSNVLQRTRAKLDTIERRLADLEAQFLDINKENVSIKPKNIKKEDKKGSKIEEI